VKVSIVVPTHGKRELATRTLESLARQREAPPFEVIVIDDGADPGLGGHVASLGLDLEFRVIHHERNRGRAAARNSGIRQAKGEVLIFLDGDMEVVPQFVAAHARAHDMPDLVVLGNILTAPEIPRTAFVEYIDSRGVKKVTRGRPIPSRYFMTGNSSVGRALLERAGPFDEEFHEYGGEDTEMGYRLSAQGGEFRYEKEAVSYHLHLNTVPEMAERLRRYGERMLPILVRKVPRARLELQLHWAERAELATDSPGTLLRKVVFSILSHRSFWAPASRLASRLPKWLRADLLFDVIRASAYLDGYRQATRRAG
jgi:glycosyltransferase involved in cell wall biosynthesis